MDISSVTIDILQNSCAKWNYAFFTRGDYNLNIIGIRSKNRVANSFDDILALAYKVNGKWTLKLYPCTTDPGTFYLKTPMVKTGTAIIVPYQYRGAYKIGMHLGKYEALCQSVKPIAVYRDNNKNNTLDYDPRTIESGFFGCNIHRASLDSTSTQVNNWSAGCQVIANGDNFREFLSLCKTAAAKYGPSTTYTLFDERQI